MMEGSLEVFLSCSQEREDRILRKKLEMQLGIWVQKGLINIWHKDKVHAGEEAEKEIHAQKNRHEYFNSSRIRNLK